MPTTAGRLEVILGPMFSGKTTELIRRVRVVLVAGLDGDFRRRPFGQMVALVPLAEHVTKLKAVCRA